MLHVHVIPVAQLDTGHITSVSYTHLDVYKRQLQMQSLRTHQAVVDAIRARDSEAARQAMRVHLEDNQMCIRDSHNLAAGAHDGAACRR